MIALFRLFTHRGLEPICVEADPHQFRHRLAHSGLTFRHVGATPPHLYDSRRYACAWDFSEETALHTLRGTTVPFDSTKRVRRKA